LKVLKIIIRKINVTFAMVFYKHHHPRKHLDLCHSKYLLPEEFSNISYTLYLFQMTFEVFYHHFYTFIMEKGRKKRGNPRPILTEYKGNADFFNYNIFYSIIYISFYC
jgi:hypothetical protein